jgi:4'-phosphopantetheinyl transferase
MLDQAIHAYVGLLDAADTPQIRNGCLATLSPDERQRAERFVFERHRHQFVLAHGLVRLALSSLVPSVDAAAWRFRADENGRPHVAGPVGAGSLHFSLSHTEGCVACVISACEAVGIDVEDTSRRDSLLAIADRILSPEEIVALRALPEADQIDRLFDYWTLKEAYVKARGQGLRLSFERFSMIGVPDEEVRIAFAADFGDDPARWRFTQSSPSRRHRLAIADGSGIPGGLPIIAQPCPWP